MLHLNQTLHPQTDASKSVISVWKKTIDPYPKRPRRVLQVLQESNLPRNSAANCRPRAKRRPLLFSCAWGDRVTAREAQENPKNFRRWCWRNWPRTDCIWHQVRTDCICLVMIVWHFSWLPQINWTIASNQLQEHTHKKTQGDITNNLSQTQGISWLIPPKPMQKTWCALRTWSSAAGSLKCLSSWDW